MKSLTTGDPRPSHAIKKLTGVRSLFAGRVIGRIMATQKTETFEGVKLLLIQPLTWDRKLDGDPLVAADAVGAGAGEFVFYVKAREAAVAFPQLPPSDATVLGIIDGVYFKEGI